MEKLAFNGFERRSIGECKACGKELHITYKYQAEVHKTPRGAVWQWGEPYMTGASLHRHDCIV